MSAHSSPFPSCFCPAAAAEKHHPPPPISGNPNLTTCVYHTDVAVFSLTWSRSFLGRSLHLNLIPHGFESPPLLSSLSFHLHLKPFIFWKKHGSKKLAPNISIFWDLSRAKFGSGPDPQSGFYVAVVVDEAMALLVGDLSKEACAKTKAQRSATPQALVLRREHVVAKKMYSTRAKFGGKTREIQIDCDYSKLCFSVDGSRVLQIKLLKWKFRGNERVEIEGEYSTATQLSRVDSQKESPPFLSRFTKQSTALESSNAIRPSEQLPRLQSQIHRRVASSSLGAGPELVDQQRQSAEDSDGGLAGIVESEAEERTGGMLLSLGGPTFERIYEVEDDSDVKFV